MPATAPPWLWRAEARLRTAISLLVLLAVGVVGVAALAFVASFVWPSNVAMPIERIQAGNVTDFQVGEPVFFSEGDFWVVRLDEKQVIALYAKDPRLGCTVPWLPHFALTDSATGESRRGWFRNPCQGQAYALDGHCVFGPCIRGLDRRPVTITDDGKVVVNINDARIQQGQPLPYYPLPTYPTLTPVR